MTNFNFCILLWIRIRIRFHSSKRRPAHLLTIFKWPLWREEVVKDNSDVLSTESFEKISEYSFTSIRDISSMEEKTVTKTCLWVANRKVFESSRVRLSFDANCIQRTAQNAIIVSSIEDRNGINFKIIIAAQHTPGGGRSLLLWLFLLPNYLLILLYFDEKLK